jgi:hypothetical protein
MRRFMLHLLVATIAFIIGVTAANLLGARFGQSRHEHRFRRAYVEGKFESRGAIPDHGCPYSRSLSELPATSEMPDAPDAPQPPGSAGEKKEVRIVETQPDGTQKVIAPRAGELKKY